MTQTHTHTLTRRQVAIEDGPKIVCLCGSTRFMEAFHAAGWQFTLAGLIVLSVGVCKHASDHGGESLGQEVADRLDELHFRKIDLADFVFVLNVGGYIGDSTTREIDYATSIGLPVRFLHWIRDGTCIETDLDGLVEQRVSGIAAELAS